MKSSILVRAAMALCLVVASARLAHAIDADGDGYDALVNDCNDNDPSIHPGAFERVGDGVDEDCDGQELCYADLDGDGFRSTDVIVSLDVDCFDAGEAVESAPLDCDDSKSSVHPGAVEVCDPNNTDEDCDGAADDSDPGGAVGKTTWYADADADGYGAGGGVLRCHGATGLTATGGDCDDSNAAIHPGAVEVCDPSNTDEDCNGAADDADPTGAVGKTTWYADADADGYGDASAQTQACHAPPGTTATVGDCDDSNPSVHPGATETVGDSIDYNCDGQELCYVDQDGDGYRSANVVVSPNLSCSDPGEAAAGAPFDCDDTNPSVHPGATEVCDPANTDEDCDGLADDADAGGAVGKTSWYADADADGYGTGSATLRCHGGPGLSATAGDCDDTDATIHPGAAEVCSNGKDDDCNAATDCADASCSADAACTVTVFDHLECFKIKTTEKLKGTVDLDPGANPPFALAAGCTIGKATKYCVPVSRTVSALDTTLTPDPSYVGQALTDSRICYKVKCPDPAPSTIDVHDQFGTRTFQNLKVTEICTPAEQAP